MSPALVVMAAGLGSRYGGVKQVEAIGPNGETLIEYSVYDAIRAGYTMVVFVIRRQIAPAFKGRIGNRIEGNISTEYVFQEVDRLPHPFKASPTRTKPWGTGHAILVAEEVVSEPFAAINADNFYGANAFHVLGDHLRTPHDPATSNYVMVGFVLRDTLSDHGSVSRAVCRLDTQGFLQTVTEVPRITWEGDRAQYRDEEGMAHPLSGAEVVSRNMWGFTTSIFHSLREEFVNFLEERGREDTSEFLIPTVVNKLIAKGLARVKVLPSQERGFGVTYRKDVPDVVKRIEHLVACGAYPKKLWD